MAYICENFQKFTYKTDAIMGRRFDDKLVQKYCAVLRSEDSMSVLIKSELEPIGVYNPLKEEEWTRVREDLENYLDEDVYMEVHIQKSMKNGYINVYAYEVFCEYLQERELPKLFSELSKYIKVYGAVRCFVCDRTIDFELNSFIFSSDIERVLAKKGIERSDRIAILNKVHSIAYVQDGNMGELLPHDLKVVEASGENEIREFFEQILMVLCIGYIANDIELKEYSIVYRLMGYKVLSGEYTIKNIDDIKEATEIFLNLIIWIYAEDFNTIDKCEIARNILSLHIKDSWYELGREAYTAIISNYRVYLKTSVDHYLEIKNDVVDKITDYNEKLFESLNDFATSLKNNILALFSFFVTTLVVNTIATGKIQNIFTKDIVTLSIGFIVISGIYLLVLWGELVRKRKDIKQMYDNGKAMYADVLSQEDILNIYCNDEMFQKNSKIVDGLMKRYVCYWGTAMIVVYIVITQLQIELFV